MIYAYIRVSTDKQTVENQRAEIENFAQNKGMIVQQWVEEVVSGTKKASERLLGDLIDKVSAGDIIIVSELSRIGRKLMDIMDILKKLMDKNVKMFTVKENYELGDSISSKVLAFAFGLSAEIERNLISQRTKEALSRRKALGHRLGRPKDPKGMTGSAKRNKLWKHRKAILEYRKNGVSISAIARIYKCHRFTVSALLEALDTGGIKNSEAYQEVRMKAFHKEMAKFIKENHAEYKSKKAQKAVTYDDKELLISLRSRFPYSVIASYFGLDSEVLRDKLSRL